ncbi:unnamed protein product [Notodromas monacha]|uniref:RING-type E3 ubiquitin transferase n=1 Tax=Notodromas monacha TaxID=399045 RepID=A0A7R9BZJ7_9CRUS|nr:unnamed protein product [Notodromas monacha]CAG0923463.1 unnamed protein product [Notodromas monacha]
MQIIDRIAGNSSDRRRNVYMRNQWAFPFSFNGRNLNPGFFRENEAQTHRILAWLNRELVAIRSIGIRNLPLRYDPVISVTSEEMDSLGDLLRRFHLLSAEMLSHLARFVGTRLARHFLHELYVFADSRFTLAQYDRQVDYSRTSEAYRLYVESVKFCLCAMGHGHGANIPKVPDYKAFVVGDHTPDLRVLQSRLAMHGLKDPWIRNEVFRFDITNYGDLRQKRKSVYLRGMRTGFILAGVTVALEYIFGASGGHH